LERAAFKQVHFLQEKGNALFESALDRQRVTSYLGGSFALKVKSENELRGERSGLKIEEAAVLTMLRNGLGHESSPHASTAARNAPQTANITQVRR
jgi:hypothetical protein